MSSVLAQRPAMRMTPLLCPLLAANLIPVASVEAWFQTRSSFLLHNANRKWNSRFFFAHLLHFCGLNAGIFVWRSVREFAKELLCSSCGCVVQFRLHGV